MSQRPTRGLAGGECSVNVDGFERILERRLSRSTCHVECSRKVKGGGPNDSLLDAQSGHTLRDVSIHRKSNCSKLKNEWVDISPFSLVSVVETTLFRN